jgi:hypothetical protein
MCLPKVLREINQTAALRKQTCSVLVGVVSCLDVSLLAANNRGRAETARIHVLCHIRRQHRVAVVGVAWIGWSTLRLLPIALYFENVLPRQIYFCSSMADSRA